MMGSPTPSTEIAELPKRDGCLFHCFRSWPGKLCTSRLCTPKDGIFYEKEVSGHSLELGLAWQRVTELFFSVSFGRSRI